MAAPAVSKRVGYAVLSKGASLQPWHFAVPAVPGDQEIDIRVTVRRVAAMPPQCQAHN